MRCVWVCSGRNMAVNFGCRQLDLHGVGGFTASVSRKTVTNGNGNDVHVHGMTLTDSRLQ